MKILIFICLLFVSGKNDPDYEEPIGLGGVFDDGGNERIVIKIPQIENFS